MIDQQDHQVKSLCSKCGQEFFRDTIMVGRLDLAEGLYQLCEPCRAELVRATARAARLERELALEADIVARIPPDYRATSWKHPKFNAELGRAVVGWSPTANESWLGIVGPSGVCKTRSMALLAIALIHSGSRIEWTTAMRLSEASDDRKSFDAGERALAREHLRACRHASWLFVDDLGKNEWTLRFEIQLFQILDHRKAHGLPIVYSSNVHPEQFSQVISAANAVPIIGRLLDRTLMIDLFSA